MSEYNGKHVYTIYDIICTALYNFLCTMYMYYDSDTFTKYSKLETFR